MIGLLIFWKVWEKFDITEQLQNFKYQVVLQVSTDDFGCDLSICQFNASLCSFVITHLLLSWSQYNSVFVQVRIFYALEEFNGRRCFVEIAGSKHMTVERNCWNCILAW